MKRKQLTVAIVGRTVGTIASGDTRGALYCRTLVVNAGTWVTHKDLRHCKYTIYLYT